ncbi:hypothetical protein PV08_03962 [Exophiala spinifera]|uniref:Major facilitator superfamily (MFS) profile domain-containing protein n=1 Tax=Exophiala spinifera TaxID=91928 RepID=A0A0D1ZVM6_9EURO|nr:uncharacterized protein PV08_03962 [Exophiala spinifera]KIW16772.1 hypothetical protein PV08_03962 [Exophiala spinifera]
MPELKALDDIEHVHGTYQLIAHNGHLQYKKGTSIVLVPQPKLNDPNDPLNWPLWKRLGALHSVLMFTSFVNFSVIGLSPGFGSLAEQFHLNSNELTWLISAPNIGQFIGCFAFAPLANIVGRRPIWLGCALIFLVGNIWAASAKSYGSLMVARIPLGVITLHDLFFLHERGTQASIQTQWLTLGATLAPVISGFLIQAKGWRWFHWLTAILAGFDLILIFLLSPETRYQRNYHDALDSTHAQTEEEFQEDTKVQVETVGDKESPDTLATHVSRNEIKPAPSWLSSLKPWSPINKQDSVLAANSRVWALLSFFMVSWGVVAFALHVTCLVIITETIPLYTGAPPYNFSSSAQGLTFLSTTIGTILGALICGKPNDWLARFWAKRNKGVFEPEMRLPFMIVPQVLVTIGLVIYGVGFHNHYHWIVPLIGDAFIGSGIAGTGSVLQPYLMDSYPAVVNESLIIFNGLKQIIVTGVSFGVGPWLNLDGDITVFCTLAALVFAVDCGWIIVFIWGKQLRRRDSRLKIFWF